MEARLRARRAVGSALVGAVGALYWGITDQFFLNDDFWRLLALQSLQDASLGQALWSLVDNPYPR